MNDVEITLNGRGFEKYGDNVTGDYGELIRVCESSAARGPHCWLEIESPMEKYGGMAAAHLTLDQAIAIRDRLSAFIDHAPKRWGFDGVLPEDLT